MLRGAFPLEDPPYWKKAVEGFENGVPRFKSKKECIAFIREHHEKGSNPDETHLRHSITTLTDWKQIEKYLLPRIASYSGNKDGAVVLPQDGALRGNVFVPGDAKEEDKKKNQHKERNDDEDEDDGDEGDPLAGRGRRVYDYLLSRVNLPIHSSTSRVSTENTLRYLFFHMRCGIFVMIRGGKPVIFCPFVNKHYKNNWKGALTMDVPDNDPGEYYQRKGTAHRENFLSDVNEWWANGNIICNVHTDVGETESQWWGDHFNFQLLDMVSETCRTRTVPDCEFFINKRDYPHLKYNEAMRGPAEPYGFIYDKDDRDPDQDLPLQEDYSFPAYAPILSFYSSARFSDIPMPPSEDWEAATGEIFPPSFNLDRDPHSGVTQDPKPRDLFTAVNLKKFEKAWEDKVATAFFRGTATGGGVTADTNQRLHVTQLCYEWGQEPLPADGVPYLDAQITGMNNRDKKIAGQKMTHINKDSFPFQMGRQNFTPIYEQSSYKYLMYIEGHCAACRYGFMMRLGSVILKVESKCVADQMWYFPLLKPYYDHVPVKADLSDLKQQLLWCRDHDADCRQIAHNASLVYDKYVGKEGILDYMQTVFVELGKRHTWLADWIDAAPLARDPPQLPGHSTGVERLCCFQGLCDSCMRRQARTQAERLTTSQAEHGDEDSAPVSARQATANGMQKMRERRARKQAEQQKATEESAAKRSRQSKGARFA